MAKKDKKETGMSIEDTVKSLKRKFGEGSVMRLDQKPLVGIDAIPTGSFGLDQAIGIGGFPQGRIIEIFGTESSGKTTLALHTVAEAQKRGGVCAYIDAEHAMDPEYAKKLGVNTAELFISQPGSGEEGLTMCEAFVESGKFAVVVIDSVASLTPQAEIDGEVGDAHIARLARLMSSSLRKLISIGAKSKTVIIFINQIRVNPAQGGYGSPEYTPGGKALKFYASVRLDIRRIAQIKKGEETMGGRVRIKVVKNKVAPPFRQTEFDLMFGEGISREGEIIALGQLYSVITKSGNSYFFGEQKLGGGYDASRVFLKENKDLAEEIIKEIKEKTSLKADKDVDLEESTTTDNE